MITVRKLQLTIENENEKLRKEQYKFIRDSQYSQYQGLNRCMGYLMSGYYSNNMDIKSDKFKEFQKTIKNSTPCLSDIEFGQGVDSKSAITQKVKKDFSIALKNGLAKGERNVTNYKRTFPLMTRGRSLNFYQDEETDEIYIKWVNKIVFKVILCYKLNKNYIGEAIGSYDDLTRVKTQFKVRYERLQRKIKLTKGGHGRKDKLKKLNDLSEKEKNYTKTYNHLISKRVIEFAKKNKASQINMELLHMSDEENLIGTLRYWSYYQLQQQIQYKAEREGILVKYIDPYHTSQICSICGHWEEGQRDKQEHFKCKSCGHEENADRNASRNIAKSKLYITKKEQSLYFNKMIK